MLGFQRIVIMEPQNMTAIFVESIFEGESWVNMGYKRFRHKGFDKVQMDFALFAMAFDLKKLCKNLLKRGFWLVFETNWGRKRALMLFFIPANGISTSKTLAAEIVAA